MIAETVQHGSLLLAIPLALAAGLVSFLSPCVLPLVPGYLSYVTRRCTPTAAPNAWSARRSPGAAMRSS
ncbi:cytochrome c biogenesis protein CcdA, partial [Streptomonospora algeriensis]